MLGQTPHRENDDDGKIAAAGWQPASEPASRKPDKMGSPSSRTARLVGFPPLLHWNVGLTLATACAARSIFFLSLLLFAATRHICKHKHAHTRKHQKERESESESERDRETERQRQRETERDRERQRETERDRERQRGTERDGERRRETERDPQRRCWDARRGRVPSERSVGVCGSNQPKSRCCCHRPQNTAPARRREMACPAKYHAARKTDHHHHHHARTHARAHARVDSWLPVHPAPPAQQNGVLAAQHAPQLVEAELELAWDGMR